MTSPREAEREARAASAGQQMFEMLRQAGIDRLVADYDARAGELDLRRVTLFKGHDEVGTTPPLNDLQAEVGAYLRAALPDGWDIEAGSYGEVRLYPASGYATFQHAERFEEYLPFTLGVPGAEVPDRDR